MKTEEEVMMKTFAEKELEEKLHQLQKEKSPGTDGITKRNAATPVTISKEDTTEDLQCQLENASDLRHGKMLPRFQSAIKEKTRPK